MTTISSIIIEVVMKQASRPNKQTPARTPRQRRHATRRHVRNVRRNSHAFTIIEVMIVLAIAGLIMLIVFLAIPALQRAARNANRRHDVGLVIAYVNEYRTHNKGEYPPSCNTLIHSHCFLRDVELNWYDNKTLDPSVPLGENKNDVSFRHRTAADIAMYGDPNYTPEELDNKLSLRLYARCDENNQITSVGANPNDFATEYTIETASGLILECREG